MADEDWRTFKLPTLMAQAVEEFLKTDVAKKNGIKSKSDFMVRLVQGFFANYEKEFGLFVPRKIIRSMKEFETTKPFDEEN